MIKTKWLKLTLIVLILWIQTSIAALAQAEKATAFVHVNLVPMTEEKVLLDQTVIVKVSHIIAIGPTKEVEIPGNAISIKGPSGRLPLQKKDFTYLPHLRDFWIQTPGKPLLGTYTIEVNSGTQNGSATVIQAVVKTIPLPEIRSFTPLNGATLKSGNPTFSWQALKAKEPLYYRLEINKRNGGRVYATGYVKNMRSHAIPKGLLRSGQSYRWRIRIADGDHWKKVQNSSRCAWQIFHLK